MSDLIERLRSAAWAGPIPCPVCDEAADELERLRREIIRQRESGESGFIRVFIVRPLR